MYDALIIGSGIGSLTTAGLLAQTAGLRVLVLEKHSTPGGLTHSSAQWEHHGMWACTTWGDMEPGSRPRSCWTTSPAELVMDAHADGLRPFLPARPRPRRDDPFQPPGVPLLLTSLFPREKRAIRRYCADVQRAYSWMSLGYVREMVPPRAAPAVRLAQPSARRLRARADGTLHGAPIPRPPPCAPSSPRTGVTTVSNPRAVRLSPTR